ncbi:PREDICTED: general transcription factor IIH subunit 5 isoform X1 [Dinoponera quadriceps]|uniref:General transcription and DNA repair factor IIH subunit TFB5 n=1 Tax=Dinoponera quadriceps TaxID=609295 RepID=A0A6P3X2Z9_DINQU|nr:PREDICTED: general transcription factor IIH subunit 5 isoform X1 [Dinoponera quadriceps]
MSPRASWSNDISIRYNCRNCIFSDAAMKQFLLHLDDTSALGKKFIIQDLDERHLFISADILETLQAKVDDLMDQISFPLAEKGM